MAKPLTFISAAILERIENGSFVPARRSKTGTGSQMERRSVLSPLSVTKRCIRYEPTVFAHRPSYILKMAHALNEPLTKILLVGGPQGAGKTSLVRGLIELMGSQNEQLLWFDVNRHTDFEEIIQFLIQYITYVCTNVIAENGEVAITLPEANPQEAPIKRLESLIRRVADMPLLLVLDNVEYIVDPELRFNSYPFKEMLNFLLAFPNIKMILIGERLPYADMSPNQEGVTDIRLNGLLEKDAVQFLASLSKTDTAPDAGLLENLVDSPASPEALRRLWHKTDGQPWLLKIAYYLNHMAHLDFQTLNRMLESSAQNAGQQAGQQQAMTEMVSTLYQRLPEQHRRLFQVLSLIRHPVDTQTLLALVGVCFPVLGPSGLDAKALQDMLEHSLLKGVLKINYPPQEVMNHIRSRRQQGLFSAESGEREKTFKPWYELYHAIKKVLYNSLPPEERERLHATLQDFYLREKGYELDARILKIKNRAVLSEAKYHGSAARERKPASGGIMMNHAPDGASIATKGYLSGFGQPIVNTTPLTLNDYKNSRLPDSASEEHALEAPSFMNLLQGTVGKQSIQEQLAGLELTEEEKQLLSRSESLGEMLNPSEPKPGLPSVKPEPKPEAKPAPVKQPSKPKVDVLSESQLAQAQDEQEKHIQKRLAAAVANQDRHIIARELVELARYRASHGRFESAGHCLEKALSLKSDAGKEIIAEIYRLHGSVNKETFHHNAALPSLTKAAEQIHKLMYEDDTVGPVWLGRLGQVYQDLGEIHAYRKHEEEAVTAFQQALRWYNSCDDTTRQAEVHFRLATVYDDHGKSQEAIEHYQKALALDEAQGNQQSAAAALANLAGLYHETKRFKESVDCFQRSLAYDRATHNLEGQWSTLDALSSLYLEQNHPAQAELFAKQGLGMAVHEGSHLWQASFYTKLGQVAETQQDWKQACQYFQMARSTGTQVLSEESLNWLHRKISDAQQQF